MKIARIAAVAISIAAAIPTGGSSLFASTLLSSALGVTTAAASAIAAGFTVATSIGAGLLAKKPSGGGSQTDWSADPNANIPLVFGRTGVGGNVVYRKGSGDADKNKYQTVTTVLSLGPIDAYETLYCDRKAVGFSGTNAVTSPYSNRLWMDSQLGACPEAAALDTGVGAKPGWTAAHKLSGLAADQVTMRYDASGKNTFTTEPQMLRVIRGLLCYDPREDSTYPGGAGLQRADDQSTWAFSKNPFVQGLSFALGWNQNGKRRAGAGQSIETIDVASFVECANIADLNGWTSGGGDYTTGDDKWEVLKALLQAGGGEPIRDGAMLSCIIQAPRVPIATITADDLIGKASVPRSRPRKERLNGVVPKYRTEQNFWATPSGTVARITEFMAVDGGERTREITYPFVQVETGQDASQPTQLAGYDVETSRERMPITLPLKLRWIGYRTGDCIDCSINNLGLGDVQLVIIKRSLDPATGAVTLTVRTEDPDKHARVFALTGDLPPVTAFERPDTPSDIALDTSDPSAQIRLANVSCATSILVGSDAGDGTGSITIADTVWDYPGATASVTRTGGTITGVDLATRYYVYFDDASLANTAPAYVATTDLATAANSTTNPDRHYLGYVDVPAAGGGSTPGGGGGSPGCPAPHMYLWAQGRGKVRADAITTADKVWACHEITGIWDWYPVGAVSPLTGPLFRATIGGQVYETTGSHLWRLPGESAWRMMEGLRTAEPIGTGDALAIQVDDAHTYLLFASADDQVGVLSHNKLVSPN